MRLGAYILRRAAFTVVVLIAISIVSFVVIELPPGDYVATHIERLKEQGTTVDESQIEALRIQYGLDQPQHVRFYRWIKRIVTEGDFGRSFEYNKPVADLLKERLPITIAIQAMAMLVSYLIAIPIGVYSATHQYTVGDYVFSAIGFFGMAVPGFLTALLLLWVSYMAFGTMPVGLFSMAFQEAPWSTAKFLDMLRHLPIPLLVIGLSGTAGTIRTMRAVLLDELGKPYVTAARIKGMPERRLLWRYPVRVSLNPIVSGMAHVLPALVSGGTIIEIVLNLPTVGPRLFRALMGQDMFLAGSCVMLISTMTVLGVLMADVLLAIADPRIRMER